MPSKTERMRQIIIKTLEAQSACTIADFTQLGYSRAIVYNAMCSLSQQPEYKIDFTHNEKNCRVLRINKVDGKS